VATPESFDERGLMLAPIVKPTKALGSRKWKR
jgi:hypothetical protein